MLVRFTFETQIGLYQLSKKPQSLLLDGLVTKHTGMNWDIDPPPSRRESLKVLHNCWYSHLVRRAAPCVAGIEEEPD